MTLTSPMTEQSPTMHARPSFMRDERGVIMMVGVFFTLLLIGLCWFIFGIGNAIAYRENLQNAADSAAFAAAVYDARGMNLLAMVNIIMATVLATLFIAKFVEIAAVLSDISNCNDSIDNTENICKAAETPITLAICAAKAIETYFYCNNKCGDIQNWQKRLKTFDSGVHTALKVLHDLEVTIAVGWPWVSAGKSGNVQSYYADTINLKNGVGATSSFAYSQIPWSADTKVGNLLSGGGGTPTTQTRYGLPVTSDTYADLCVASFNTLTNLGGVVTANPISKYAGEALDWFSQWMCDDATGSGLATGIIEGIPAIVGVQAVAFCAIDKDMGAIIKAIKGGFLSTENAATPLPMSMAMPGVKKTDFEYSPMGLFPPAKMGLDYFGVWSTVIGDYDDTYSNQRVAIAGYQTKGNPVVAAPPEDVFVGVAKAEFYYDPRKSDTLKNETKMDIPDQLLDVMWNMRWRARMRRYHYFPGADGVVDSIIDLMNTGFANVASSAIQALLAGKNPMTTLIGPEVSVNTLPSGGAPNIFH